MSDSELAEDARPKFAPSPVMRVIVCPRCRVPAQQNWFDLMVGGKPSDGKGRFFDEASADFPLRPQLLGGVERTPATWRAAHCSACDQKTLWRDDVCVYPIATRAPAPHPSMDEAVRRLYEEAGRVLPLSRSAGAALVRAALEKQVRLLDSDAPRGTRLDDHIARLSREVSRPLGEVLDIIRHVGNAALHGSQDDDLVYMYMSEDAAADELAEMMFEAINDLVEELVARPEKTSSLWKKLPSGVKETIERKRAQQEAE